MIRSIHLLAAGAIALSPSIIFAHPGNGGGSGHGAMMSQGAGMGRGGAMSTSSATGRGAGMNQMGTATRTSQGPTNGVGWDHANGPSHPTGQPGFECEDIRPGHASSAPGSAFNPDGNAGTHYAGEQPQNSRNTASVSQYDTACLHQPQH